MKSFKRKSVLVLLLLSFLLTFTACSGNSNENKNKDKNNNKEPSAEVNSNANNNVVENENNNTNVNNNAEANVEAEEIELQEVTLKVAFPMGEEYFNLRYGVTNEKLNEIGIELEYVPYSSSVESLEELFANKINPDIIIGDYQPIEELGVEFPLDDLIERHGFDIDRLDPSLLAFMQSHSDEGKVVGFPDGTSFWGLYYNKEVFDKFGKDYPDPDEPMTWEELIDLVADMTREVDGVQYYGLAGAPTVALDEFAAHKTDPETGEVLVEKDPNFKRYLELIESYYNIPGMKDPDNSGDPFVQEQTAAMVTRTNDWLKRGWGDPDPSEVEHIDLVPMPVWEDMPTTMPAKDSWFMVIPEYTEYKDEAFKALTTFYEIDIQVEMAKNMSLQTPLIDEEILDEYGTDIPTYDGKNVQAYFYGQPAIFEGRQSTWDRFVDINSAIDKIRDEDMDAVTALRQLVEESEGKIEEAKVGGQSGD